MKVTGPGRTTGPSKTSKGKKSGETDTSFGDFLAQQTQGSSGASATQSIAQVDALLAVQATEDPTERASRGRMHQRSQTVLDELEKIRMAMLSGSLTVGHMIDVADVVASHREKITDPALTAIMDEIDLRAQVELAKMRVAMDAAALEANDNSQAT